jgi:hypothetical protein
MKSKILKYSIAVLVVIAVVIIAVLLIKKPGGVQTITSEKQTEQAYKSDNQYIAGPSATTSIKQADGMPVYGNWRNFTTKDGLPSDKVYAVKIDGDRVLVGI